MKRSKGIHDSVDAVETAEDERLDEATEDGHGHGHGHGVFILATSSS
jgi:hypothetical protein